MKTEIELRLPVADARAISLARALDEVDRLGELLPVSERQQATQDAFSGVDVPESLDNRNGRKMAKPLAARAARLGDALATGKPELRSLVNPASGRGITAGVVIVAAVVGAASNVLGPEKAVSVLAPPLLGLIVWNLAIFAWILLSSLRRLVRRPAEGVPPQERLRWLAERWTRSGKGGGEASSTVARLTARHKSQWLAASMPLETARWAGRLHLAAAVMVMASVAGMYFRGLAFEYRATWESTFLDAGTVDAILNMVLAPAMAVLGVALPSVESLRTPDSGPAAPWIHAWALSALMLVVAPRLLLATAELLRASTLRRRLPIRVPIVYLRRVLATASTTPHEVQILPYSYRPVEKSTEILRRLLLDFLGARANLRFGTSLAYGDAPPSSSAAWRVLLFSLAQTPEIEVHGEALRQITDELADGQRLLVLVDEAPLLARVPSAQKIERRESRRRAWLRNLATVPAVAGSTGAPRPVFLAIDDSLDPDLALEDLTRGAWPPAAGGHHDG